MKLTENFCLSEFTKSQTALRLGIDNRPNGEQISNLIRLCKYVLQPLRDYYGKPIRVNSGFRSFELNSLIGGSKTSDHLQGCAADIDTISDNALLFNFIKNNLVFDQLIWEFGNSDNPDWVHVSFSVKENIGQILKAERKNGKVIYIDIT